MGPLEGVRVIDLTHVWAGPLGTRILGDFGADVIKVEAPFGRGPAALPANTFGFWQGPLTDQPYNRQAGFNKLSRNKRSMCVDLKMPGGRAVFLDLVRHADAVVENFSARAMGSLGIGYNDLRKVKTDLIHIAMPGYGSYGPNSDYVAYGPSVEPTTGLTWLMGYGPDEPRPTLIGIPDAVSGAALPGTLVNALLQRRQTGKGGFIDLALQESAIGMLGEYFVEYQLSGEDPAIRANRHREFAPQGIYPCLATAVNGEERRNHIFITCRDDTEWSALCDTLNPDWRRDPRFATREDRRTNHDALDREISGVTATRDKMQLMTELQSRGVAAGAVTIAPEFMGAKQVVERGYFVELGNDDVPAIPFPGNPVIVDGKRHEGWRAAPKLGEHNRDVLRDVLGYAEEDIDRLYEAGVIMERPPE